MCELYIMYSTFASGLRGYEVHIFLCEYFIDTHVAMNYVCDQFCEIDRDGFRNPGHDLLYQSPNFIRDGEFLRS